MILGLVVVRLWVSVKSLGRVVLFRCRVVKLCCFSLVVLLKIGWWVIFCVVVLLVKF